MRSLSVLALALSLSLHLPSLASARDRAELAPWVIAHRGASADAPENTMASFRLALEYGADALETDVQTTSDGVLVLLHDDTLDRTTNGHGPISKLTLAQVRALDAGSWKAARFAGERIPTLDGLLDLAKEAGVGLVVEAKTPYVLDPGLAGRIVEALDRHGMTQRAIVQSFDHRPLAEVHRRRPDVKTGPLVDAGIDEIEGVLRGAGTYAYLVDFAFALPDRVRRIHRYGCKVAVWTVDDPKYMLAMIDAGVDGIMTNHARVLRRLTDELHLSRRPWPGVRR